VLVYTYAAMSSSFVGTSVRRLEDPRLITGGGTYVDDLEVEGGLFAVFARSPLAHARIARLSLEAAARLPGVAGAFAAGDLRLPARLSFAVMPDAFARPPLAVDVVRFVGEPVAVVLGETRAAAVDGALAVEIDYEPLPVVATTEAAAAQGGALLFPEHGSNLAFEAAYGGDSNALDGAEVTVRARFTNQRLAAVPMEPNAFAAAPDPDTGGLRVWASTQSPFQVRDFVADCLGLPESQVRCVAPDVGGGFGAKLAVYHEQAVVAELARRLQRPVRWVETRSESFVALTHGRGQVQDVELGASRDGRVTGLRVRIVADAGAYAGQGAFLPLLTGQMLSGVYAIPRIDFLARSYVTDTTPTGAYRGAGRPEATALIERAMDMLAAELRMDPAELRRRNLISRDAFPYETPGGGTYDSGDYGAALERVLQMAGYDQLRAEQRRRREAGSRKLLGIGLSCYVEVTALGSPMEYAAVEAGEDGTLTVAAGTHSHGQGHETAFAQIAADQLGAPLESIRVLEGDTAAVPRGDGTSGSRSVQLGGSAVHEAARALFERARKLAADLLEASPDDVVALTDEGGLGVRGAPGRGLTWGQLAVAARERGEGPLKAEEDLYADSSYPFGAHLAVVEVDADTGEARLVRHVAVDDCGVVVNPVLADGQVHGGIAQGAAQALFEEMVYDADANPLTASLLDYTMPTANELPWFETDRTMTPSPNNPLGAKGIGESGTIGSTPAVQNAVIDAVTHLGVRHIDMPLAPERVWRSLKR
jgi:carbon-monoxide dehydrogenase large subunit